MFNKSFMTTISTVYVTTGDLAQGLQKEVNKNNSPSYSRSEDEEAMKIKARGLIKKLTGYLAIELFVPGGTLVVLGLLFFGGSFPMVQDRVLGMLPKNLSALIRPEKPDVDRPQGPAVSSAGLDRTKG